MKKASYYIEFKSIEDGIKSEYTYPCANLIHARRMFNRMKVALHEEEDGHFKGYLNKSNDFIIKATSTSFSIKDATTDDMADIQLKKKYNDIYPISCAQAVKRAIKEIKEQGMQANRCKSILSNLIFKVGIRIYDNSPYTLKKGGFYPLSEDKKHTEDFYNQFTLEVAEQISKDKALSKIR